MPLGSFADFLTSFPSSATSESKFTSPFQHSQFLFEAWSQVPCTVCASHQILRQHSPSQPTVSETFLLFRAEVPHDPS
jgi:hypothetical protein